MTDPKRPTDAELQAEVAEFRRFAETDLVPMLLANPKLPLPEFMAQVMARWGMASKAGQEEPPTSEQIKRWEAQVNAFFDALQTEFPTTHRDPAFREAMLARLPALVKQLMGPTS